jgi:hypothetical protein
MIDFWYWWLFKKKLGGIFFGRGGVGKRRGGLFSCQEVSKKKYFI